MPIWRIFQNSTISERLDGFEQTWVQNDRKEKHYRFGTLYDGSKVIKGHLTREVGLTHVPPCSFQTRHEKFLKTSWKVQFFVGFPTVCRTLKYPNFSRNGSRKTKFKGSLAIPEALISSMGLQWSIWV